MKKVALIVLVFCVVLPSLSMAENRLLNKDFMKSATLADIRREIENGADLNAKADENSKQYHFGDTPLMLATVYNSNSEIIKALIRGGADVSARNTFDRTALMLEAGSSKPNLEIIKVLIRSGADVNTKSSAHPYSGSTPLMFAARNNNRKVAEILIKAGADVSARSEEDGSTVLMSAALANSNSEIIKVLIRSGADVNARSKGGWTVLMFAAQINSNSEVITALIRSGADVNARSYGIPSRTALTVAAG
ncbi:MAG: ankyrin repeat domain-containing protein, partial [Thermodesulfobacteriota bacterium]